MNRSHNTRSVWVDSDIGPHECPAPKPATRIARTLRYRCASRGVPLTVNEKRIYRLKGIHRGARCFIVGNGPSLNDTDLRKLTSEITFGVNSVFLNTQGFIPRYYVVEDVFVAEDRAREINEYKGPVKFFGNYLRYCLKGDDILWLNVIFRYHSYPGFPHFSKNALRRLWVGGTVSYLCMQLAYYMGCAEVYLVGFDHRYAISEKEASQGNRIVSERDDPNHFHKDYFGKGYRWHHPQTERMEKAYREAREVFEKSGRRIYNATQGGSLEIFKRIPYDSLF